jgi:acetyl-CoA synthetase (ADP-forming)
VPNKTSLLEHEARNLLRDSGIVVQDYEFCTSEEEAVQAADNIGYPVVLKIVSPQVIHKSDAGGVRLNLVKERDVRKAYKDIMRSVSKHSPEAELMGVLVSSYIEKGTEIIVGAINDFQFGPVVMVGLGGVFTEIFNDVSFCLAPVDHSEAMEMLDHSEAMEMLRSLKAYPIIQGVRGKKGINIEALVDLIQRVSELVERGDIEELDLNPVLCFDDKVIIIDVRILLKRPY